MAEFVRSFRQRRALPLREDGSDMVIAGGPPCQVGTARAVRLRAVPILFSFPCSAHTGMQASPEGCTCPLPLTPPASLASPPPLRT